MKFKEIRLKSGLVREVMQLNSYLKSILTFFSKKFIIKDQKVFKSYVFIRKYTIFTLLIKRFLSIRFKIS